MLLQDLIDEDLIIPELLAKTKTAAIAALAELFVEKGIVKDKAKFITMIEEREKVESTAIGEGVAIPHARSDTVSELKVALGRSTDGVDFESLDGAPVHIIFMVAAPVDARKEYLQAVAKVARFLKSDVLKGAMLRATSPKAMMDLVRDFDGVVPESLKVETKEGRVIYKKEDRK